VKSTCIQACPIPVDRSFFGEVFIGEIDRPQKAVAFESINRSHAEQPGFLEKRLIVYGWSQEYSVVKIIIEIGFKKYLVVVRVFYVTIESEFNGSVEQRFV
jgi:hypothetical protein